MICCFVFFGSRGVRGAQTYQRFCELTYCQITAITWLNLMTTTVAAFIPQSDTLCFSDTPQSGGYRRHALFTPGPHRARGWLETTCRRARKRRCVTNMRIPGQLLADRQVEGVACMRDAGSTNKMVNLLASSFIARVMVVRRRISRIMVPAGSLHK